MNEYDVKRFALVLAVQAEIEGMKAENQQRVILDEVMSYWQEDFVKKSKENKNGNKKSKN